MDELAIARLKKAQEALSIARRQKLEELLTKRAEKYLAENSELARAMDKRAWNQAGQGKFNQDEYNRIRNFANGIEIPPEPIPKMDQIRGGLVDTALVYGLSRAFAIDPIGEGSDRIPDEELREKMGNAIRAMKPISHTD